MRLGGLRQAAVEQFLDAIGQALDEEPSPVAGRLAAIEIAPLLVQLFQRHRLERGQLSQDGMTGAGTLAALLRSLSELFHGQPPH